MTRVAAVSLIALMGGLAAIAEDEETDKQFKPGNLVVSRSVYDNQASNIAIGTILPPNCATTKGGCASTKKFKGAPADGAYPTVWNNNLYDGSFGITSK